MNTPEKYLNAIYIKTVFKASSLPYRDKGQVNKNEFEPSTFWGRLMGVGGTFDGADRDRTTHALHAYINSVGSGGWEVWWWIQSNDNQSPALFPV